MMDSPEAGKGQRVPAQNPIRALHPLLATSVFLAASILSSLAQAPDPPQPLVSTLAGSDAAGFADGANGAAKFSYPESVAVDSAGTVYVADTNNQRIRKITPAGVVSTLAGSGIEGFADGTGTAASFSQPMGIALDSAGNVYVTDTMRIRKITPAGVVSTFAGSGAIGSADGTGTAASFNAPRGLAFDGSDNLYVADSGNHSIRKITPAGAVSTLAGSGIEGFADGPGPVARFSNPSGVAADSTGTIYVADWINNRIRKITPAGIVSTLAGSGVSGFANGTGASAKFYYPKSISAGNDGNLYVADSYNNRIRKILPDGTVTVYAGTGAYQFSDGTASAAAFRVPTGVAMDGTGNLYVADHDNNRIRKIAGTAPSSLAYSANPAVYLKNIPIPDNSPSSNGGAVASYSISAPLPAGLSFNTSTGVISGTPAAAAAPADYTVTATNAGGSTTATLHLTVFDSALASFRDDHGLAADGSQDLLAPAGDGVPNLIKYAFNMVPESASLMAPNSSILAASGSSGLPLIQLDGSNHLTLTFVRRKAATAPGISYVPEVSSDLSPSWTTMADTPVVTSIDTIWERVTYTDSETIASTSRRFLRVRVVPQ